MYYASVQIRKKDRRWMSDFGNTINVGQIIAISAFWPLTGMVASAIVAAKLLFDKEG